MVSKNNKKSGYTATGFSKAGFACCSRFNTCNMGKLDCYYESIDPEVPQNCFCFVRNRTKNPEGLNEGAGLIDDTKTEFNDLEQLSLF